MKIKEIYKKYRLCLVDGNEMFFTSSFEDQWGDDWNDAPYDCNAGSPYEDDKHHVISAFVKKINLRTPCDLHYNAPYSAEDLNHKAAAWLFDAEHGVSIFGGDTLEEVIAKAKEAGEEVFLSAEEIGD